jgi:hypothetical protein
MALKDLDQWVAELRQHREALSGELERVDAALRALGVAEDAQADGAQSTREMIASLFRQHPDQAFDALEVTDWLREQGVEQAAKDPVNSVRGALSRLKQRGVITDVRRGVFKLRDASDASAQSAPPPERPPRLDELPAPPPAPAWDSEEPPF